MTHVRSVLVPLLLAVTDATNRLTITNGCASESIWIAHLANVGVGPGMQNVKIPPMASHSFTDLETDGLGGARYWAKMGCDEHGGNCKLGGSGGPSEGCSQRTPDYSSCAPPVDTKFEATFGRAGQPCNAAVPSEMGGCDSIDVSLVDGWTLPFKFEVKSGTCTAKEKTVSVIDCSGLTLDKCPSDEDLGKAAAGPVNMQAVSPHTGKPAGCYGPCLKLIDPKWNNAMAKGRKRDDPNVVPYCCTTPPLTSETCNAGPIVDTKYVKAVHDLCPGVYAFAYDDGMGLMRCTYGEYQMTFYCPGYPVAGAKAPAKVPAQSGPTTSKPYACGEGYGNWKKGWSGHKKKWCCENEGKGCMGCHDTKEGEECFKAVRWAIEHGLFEHPEWYRGLTAQSPTREFQAWLHSKGQGNCSKPCLQAGASAAAEQQQRLQQTAAPKTAGSTTVAPAAPAHSATLPPTTLAPAPAAGPATPAMPAAAGTGPSPACALHPACVAQNRAGDCCPTPGNGIMLDCCGATAAKFTSIDDAIVTTLGEDGSKEQLPGLMLVVSAAAGSTVLALVAVAALHRWRVNEAAAAFILAEASGQESEFE
eukprot:CAMPEP_0179188074 /NCGR_PEP_ID=MMETSP0796-20121207/93337_1 /TAXON_ID=73915 /ORGANISM="Pyrodinium bahamense, Strain pbaha01" /LENGTH=587 /DNA_ID=CAMNT_0020892163 /DNA_START=42 /DNA_END=1806 /DNA_ORIENTATION=+